MTNFDSLPVKIFSIDEGDIFLYEAVTNKIFRVEAGTSNFNELLADFIRNGDISAQILDTPRFSMRFDGYIDNIEKNLHGLILEVTRRCNLRCTYCVYNGKFSGRRTHENCDMSIDTMERAINFYAEHSSGINEGEISFYGGETLICADKIFYAIEYATRLMSEKKLSFTISTNALLLDDKICSFLANTPNVALNVTLNGPSHDKYRRTVDGKGTLKTLLEKLNTVKKNFPQVWKNQIGFICNYADFIELKTQRKFYLNFAGKMPLLINPIVPPNLSELLSKDEKEVNSRNELADMYFREGDMFLTSYFRVAVAVIHDRAIFANPHSFINSCIPFINKILVTATGLFQICTETVELDDFGDVYNGFNFTRLKKLYDDTEKIFFDSNCHMCWAQRLCPACFKDFLTVDGNVKMIDKIFCERIRLNLLSDLKLYCRLAYYRRDLLKQILNT